MPISVIGLFDEPTQANASISDLLESGYKRDEISVVTSTVSLPAIGMVVAGPIVGLLDGAELGIRAGVVEALIALGVPEPHAGAYAEGVTQGGSIVAIKVEDSSADRIAGVFEGHCAVDITERLANDPHPLTGISLNLASSQSAHLF